jgi:hypothetical protein
VTGSFSYNPVSGTVLGAGEHTLTATFTSTDANYSSGGTVTNSLTVNQANQTITFNPPATHRRQDGQFTIEASASSELTVSFKARRPLSARSLTMGTARLR